MEDKRIDLLKNHPVPKAIIKLAIPAIVGMLIMAIYNIVDAMFVSWIGTEEAGAIQVAFPFMMIISAISMLFALGSSVYISRLLGEDNVARANKVTSTTFVIVVISSIITMIAAYIFLDDLLVFFGSSKSILPYARQYIVFILIGTVFQMSNVTLSNLLRSEGSAMMSMVGLAVGAVLNIILDPLFIFVFKLGIRGAAIATSISAFVSFCVLITPYLKKKSVLHIKIKEFAPDILMMKEIFKIGTPSLIRNLLTSFAVGFLNQKAVQYGGESALVALGLMSRIFSMSLFIMFGFAQGFQPVAGYNYGAKRYDRLKQSLNYTILITTIISVITSIIFALLPRQIMMIFKADPDVVEIAIRAFRYIAITVPFFGYAITINFLFQAMGRGLPAAILSLSRQGLFFFPLIFTLPELLGLTGVLMTQPAADVLTLILTFILGIKVTREIRYMEKAMPRIGNSNDVLF